MACSQVDGPGAGGPDAAVPASSLPASSVEVALATSPRVLWIGAHPDDEGYASPFFAELCVRRGAACTFLSLTDGGKGHCDLGSGACGTSDAGGAPAGSVGAFRLAEARRAAALFGGSAASPAFEDTASATVLGDAQNWNQRLTGVPNDARVDQAIGVVRAAITAVAPDLVVTFDPRHGVYCQPDHRAAAALTLAATSAMGFDPARVLMVETTEWFVDASGHPAARPWVPADPAVATYDAAAAGTFPAHVAVWSTYQSQYTASDVAGLASVPAAAQGVPFLSAASAATQTGAIAAAYNAVCASEDAWWDGHGVCPRADGTTGPCW